ncbi:MAG: hypothetical protein ACRDTR_06760, partial [Rubrobacter sp.]
GAGTAVIAQQGTLPGQDDEAGEGRDSDRSLTGPSARQTADAALRSTGDGTVLEVEQGDDPGAAYEVEVRRDDGGVTEVLLDGDAKVIGQEAGD